MTGGFVDEREGDACFDLIDAIISSSKGNVFGTGGIFGTGVFTPDEKLLCVREDKPGDEATDPGNSGRVSSLDLFL